MKDAGGSELVRFAYTRDAGGNPIAIERESGLGVFYYAYDALQRLYGEPGPQPDLEPGAGSAGALKEQDASGRPERMSVEDEPLVLSEQGSAAAAGSEAFGLAGLRAGREVAEPTQQPVRPRFHDEYVHLVVSHADLAFREK